MAPRLTARDAMAYLKRSRSWLTKHADEIGYVRDGRNLFFYQADLDAWNRRHYRLPRADDATPVYRPEPVPFGDGGEINPFTGVPYHSLEARA
jgi:hypothetical protein